MNILDFETPTLNDGPSAEMQSAFVLSDFAELVARQGQDAVMNELFHRYPDIYGALCIYFYQDFYKPVEEGLKPARVCS